MPEQLCSIARRADAALEVVLGRRRRGEDPPDDRELLGRRAVRGADERDLLVVEVRPRPDDGQCLERLRRRAEVRDQPGVAGGELDPAVADGDGVDDVPRLDDVSARHLDDEWLHGAAA